MKISIAMATYNGGKYLQEQLDSFVAQTRLPDELVITDDCSTDNTLEIIEAFAAKAPFEVRWEQNKENLGYTGNFNQALMKTTGDLVFLSDQDDVWFPSKLEWIEQEAKTSAALVLMNDAALADARLNDLGLTRLGQMRRGRLGEESFVTGCCAAIKRDLLDLCLPIPDGFDGHDTLLVTLANAMGRRLIVPEVLQWYRRHESNASQGVANRSSKLNLMVVLRHKWQAQLTRDGSSRSAVGFMEKRLGLLVQGAHDAMLRSREPYRTELQLAADALDRKYAVHRRRLAIRERSRALRFVPVVRLWISGGYRQWAGLRSALRDVLFD